MRITQTGIADELCRYDWHNSLLYPGGPRDSFLTFLPVSESASEEFPGGRVFPSRLASMVVALHYQGMGLFAFFGYYMPNDIEWDLLDEDVAYRISGIDDLNAALEELHKNDYFLAVCNERTSRWVALVIAPLSVID